MKVEDIEVGKRYYYEFAFDAHCGVCLGKSEDLIVLSGSRDEIRVKTPKQVICEAPPVPPAPKPWWRFWE